jgi:tRNA A-37 threonylcarbamoyl transferase component Bud32
MKEHDMTALVGQHFGNYRLVQFLGQGAFADVYLGEHLHLPKQRAVKILYTQLTGEDIEHFRNEVRTVARLIHPHILRIHDFGIEETTPFLVMEHAFHGSLLQRHPREVPLPLATIIPYIKQIASALQYAHEQKVIHCDVKPENLLIGSNDEILLSDFGIAVPVHSEASLRTQEIGGTPSYMAPELFQGKPCPASDQYALGVIVYEWLRGARPFGGSPAELMYQHVQIPPSSLREKNPQVPLAVEEVVLKALAKEPSQRFESVQAFADALERAVHPVDGENRKWKNVQFQQLDQQIKQTVDADTGNQEIGVWEEVLRGDPGNTKARRRILKLLRQQTRQLVHAGKWDQEISVWRRVLQWQPEDAEAKVRIPIVEHNKQYAWMYENAVQLVNEEKLEAAKNLLKDMWHHAPKYGDPNNLAQQTGLDRHLETIQRATSAEEAGGCLFCLFGGVASTVGMLSHSWVWAVVSVAAAILFADVLCGYRKAMSLLSTLIIAIPAGTIACGLAWYAATLNYSEPVDGIWLDRQLDFGLILGLLSCLPLWFPGSFLWWNLVHHPYEKMGESEGEGLGLLWVFAWPLGMLLGGGWGWGFGFGFDWWFSLIGLALGLVSGTGILGSFLIWRRAYADSMGRRDT